MGISISLVSRCIVLILMAVSVWKAISFLFIAKLGMDLGGSLNVFSATRRLIMLF